MTINKKSSRKIIVRDESYIWAVSPDAGYIIVIVEHEASRGSHLEIYIESDIDSLWVNFPNTEHPNLKIIRPKDVEFFICQALDLEWTPKVKGKPIVFDFNGLKIIRRITNE